MLTHTTSWSLPVFLAIFLSLQPALVQAQGMTEPLRYVRTAGVKENGPLLWSLSLAPKLTTCDSVWLESTIGNYSEDPLEFQLSQNAWPLLVVQKDDEPPRTRSLKLNGQGVSSHQYKRYIKAYGDVHSFRVDLSQAIGELKPGNYKLKLYWPAEHCALVVNGRKTAVELQSPEVAFVVEDFNKSESERKVALVNKNARIQWGDRAQTGRQLTGKIRNNSKDRTLAIPTFLKRADGPLTQLPVPVLWRKLSGGYFWIVADEYKNRFMPVYLLRPGESIEVLVSRWSIIPEGKGHYYASVWASELPADYKKGQRIVSSIEKETKRFHSEDPHSEVLQVQAQTP